MEFATNLVKWSRKKRTEFFNPIGKFFLKLRIKAWQLTVLAFVFGVVSVYYFWLENPFYFILFGVLHLLVDGLDGVVARAGNSATRLGAHLDNISDRSIIIFLLGASYLKFHDYFILIVLGFYVLHHLIFALSDLKGRVSYCRFLVLLIYFIAELSSNNNWIFDLSFFIVGFVSLYGLSQQFNDFLRKKFTT